MARSRTGWERAHDPWRPRRHGPGVISVIAAALLVLAVLPGCFLGGVLSCINGSMSRRVGLASYQPRLTTAIYSTEVHRDGSERHTLLARIFREGEDREPAELRDIPLALQQATIAIEDHRFYEHRGISPRDIARAALANLRAGHNVQGASTITQQVARNIWLSQEKTYPRKLKEAALALALERTYSKDEILEMYLNEVYYGHGAYGVRVAAKMYFGKPLAELSLAQCALLAGIPQRPARNSPYVDPQAAKERRDQVLRAMAEAGMISPKQASEAMAVPVKEGLQPLQQRGVAILRAQHFTNAVIRDLCRRYSADLVYEGGLKVYTTLDMRVQQAAEQELSRMVERLRRSGQVRAGLAGQGALACVDVHTGGVLAMVGGVGPYEKVQYNRASPGPPQYGRQPGSSFKPYVWAAALESGRYTPYTTVSADPITITVAGGKPWRPKNYSPRQGGRYSLRAALADSVNLVSVRLVQDVGVESVIRLASLATGVPAKRFRAVPSIALGVCEVSPLEQATGYATFANGGIHLPAQLVRRIEYPEGDLLWAPEARGAQVVSAETAAQMVGMMRAVVTSGTGRSASIPGYDKVCGKTGTTQDGRDAWWVGFTPDVSCAVWIGNDDYTPMDGSAGGRFCAPVFREFVRRARDILGCDGDFPVSSGTDGVADRSPSREGRSVRICSVSGGIAGPGCPETERRFIPAGERMPPPCALHGSGAEPDGAPSASPQAGAGTRSEAGPPLGERVTASVCAQSGGLAGPACPQVVEREFSRSALPGPCAAHGSAGLSAAARRSTSAAGAATATPPAPERPVTP